VMADAPTMLDRLEGEDAEHFAEVRRLLDQAGVGYELDGTLVRGLDYYTRTIFELHYPKLGARSALCGGGRYDHLLRDLGGPDLPAIGFAIGFTGALIVLEELGLAKDIAPEPIDVYVIAAGEGLETNALEIAQSLRDAGLSAVYDVEGRSVKKQFQQASSGGFPLVAIIGEAEREQRSAQLKDLRSGEQVLVPLDQLPARARAALGRG
jgi:histidyl-tRNA synthetase